MKIKNSTNFAKSIFFIAIISVAAFGLLAPVIEATHPPGADSVTRPITDDDNTIKYRDITNRVDQVIDPVSPGTCDEGYTFNPDTNKCESGSSSVDTSNLREDFFTVEVTDPDANLDTSGIDLVLSSASSTSSGEKLATAILTETGVNTGMFTGPIQIGLSSTTGDTLELGLGDDISIFYEPEPIGVGRFSAELTGTGTSGKVELSDAILQQTIEICLASGGWDINTHPINLVFTDDPGTLTGDITVTMSWANAVDRPVLKDAMSIMYRPFQDPNDPNPPLWEDLDAENNTPSFLFKSLTSTSQPSAIEGQYALATNLGGCFGGGGGGLVRPGLVVNALAGSGSILGLFSGGSGGGAHPTFGDASLLVLEDIAQGAGGTISDGTDISLDSTKVVKVGDTVVMRFNLYENQGITNLERFRMFLNFEGENYDASTIDTHITYQRGGEVTVVDPHEKIAKVEIKILQADPWNLVVSVQIIFNNPFNTSILVESWDLDRNSGKKLFPDALQVEESSILLADAQIELETTESILTTEDMTEIQLTEIPVWVKSNALWWEQKQIDDSDFMAGIKYLVQKTIIEIDENELSTSATSSEIPVWIRDIAGMWADYSITDEEFVNAMKWLLSNGILEVQQ